MRFQGSVITEQGITFAMVIVKKQANDQTSDGDQAIRSFRKVFPGIPVVLM